MILFSLWNVKKLWKKCSQQLQFVRQKVIKKINMSYGKEKQTILSLEVEIRFFFFFHSFCFKQLKQFRDYNIWFFLLIDKSINWLIVLALRWMFLKTHIHFYSFFFQYFD